MEKNKRNILVIVGLAVTAILFYCIGYQAAYSKMENSIVQNKEQTFYATITGMSDDIVEVQGLSVNDINYRGEFVFQIIDEIEWRGTTMAASELEIGDRISITFTGGIQETYPASIENVIRIQLLEDE